MTGKRIFAIFSFGILVSGVLTALWLLTSPAQRPQASHAVADQRAEMERRRHEVVQQVALKQQRLEERQLAEAQRLAEQERQRRDAERKRRQDEEERRLADTVSALEKERLRQAEIVQASLKHRQDEELKLAEARRLAEQERLRREIELKEAARKQQLELEERRIADAVRQLEKERVRQAAVVQASIKQRADTERRHVAEAVTNSAPKSAEAGPKENSARPTASKPSKYRVSSGKPLRAGRSRKCVKPCPAATRPNRTASIRHARWRVPASGESLASFCPWRWVEGVIAELLGPVRVAERTSARRLT